MENRSQLLETLYKSVDELFRCYESENEKGAHWSKATILLQAIAHCADEETIEEVTEFLDKHRKSIKRKKGI